jgi:hypothetical protein
MVTYETILYNTQSIFALALPPFIGNGKLLERAADLK